jgi:hypothetical protein
MSRKKVAALFALAAILAATFLTACGPSTPVGGCGTLVTEPTRVRTPDDAAWELLYTFSVDVEGGNTQQHTISIRDGDLVDWGPGLPPEEWSDMVGQTLCVTLLKREGKIWHYEVFLPSAD